MKVTAKVVTPPVIIELTYEEACLLKRIMFYDVSIPKVVTEDTGDQVKIHKFIRDLNTLLMEAI